MNEIDAIVGAVAAEELTNIYKKADKKSQEAFLSGAAAALAYVKILTLKGEDVSKGLAAVLDCFIEEMEKADK